MDEVNAEELKQRDAILKAIIEKEWLLQDIDGVLTDALNRIADPTHRQRAARFLVQPELVWLKDGECDVLHWLVGQMGSKVLVYRDEEDDVCWAWVDPRYLDPYQDNMGFWTLGDAIAVMHGEPPKGREP